MNGQGAMCVGHAERLTAVEQRVSGVSTLVDRHDAAIARHEERIGGLSAAHAATIEAVRSLNKSIDKMGDSFASFDAQLHELLKQFAEARISAEKEKRSMASFALGLWLTSIGFLLSCGLWVGQFFYPSIKHAVSNLFRVMAG